MLIGQTATDNLAGGDGDDLLVGGLGTNTIDGGSGIDTAGYFTATAGVTASLNTGTATSTGLSDTFTSIENLIGSEFNDTLVGNAASNFLSGRAGTDIINGAGGNDIIHGGAGNDTLTGSTGSNTFLWLAGDAVPMPAVDVITDFKNTPVGSGGDVVNLKELLSGEHSLVGSGSLDGYLNFSQTGANTTLAIDTTGSGNFSSPAQTIVFQNVDLTHTSGGALLTNAQVVDSLLQGGNLIVDA